MRRVGVIGSATIDRNQQGGFASVKLGGVVTYAGLTFRRHGLATTAVTNVAREDTRILDLLRSQGIECVVGKTVKTTRFVNRLEGSARQQEMPACASPIAAIDVLAMLDHLDHIHLGPLHPCDIEAPLFSLLSGQDITVSLDIQGCVRRIVNHVVQTAASSMLSDALQCADYVKADQAEFDVVLDALDTDVEALMDEYEIREVVVTQGLEGGFVVESSGKETSYSAVKIENEVDSTGAGDVFMAAYLVARLRESQTVSASSRYAAEVAAGQVAGKYIPVAVLCLDTPSLKSHK